MRWLAIPCALLAIGLWACISGEQLARTRASNEYDCPESKISVKYIGASQIGDVYRVRACGVTATYACDETKEACIKESDDR